MSILVISFLVVLSIVLIVLLTSVTKLNAFASLFIVSLLLAITALPEKGIVDILKEGFGNTVASIGFLVIFGRLSPRYWKRPVVHLALPTISYQGQGIGMQPQQWESPIHCGIAHLCDSGYIIMSGLAKRFSSKAKVALTVIAFVLATSLYSVHCLTPTHPGALAASDSDANIGMLIVLGTLFTIPAALSAFCGLNGKPGSDLKEREELHHEVPCEEQLPPVHLSLLPVVVPLLLIATGSLLTVLISPTARWY